jgi:hypothetical protein
MSEALDAKREWLARISDRGLRHKTGVTTDDYLKAFLEVGREFAFATPDDSWGEFEKLFHIMAMSLYDSKREVKALKDDLEVVKVVAPAEWAASFEIQKTKITKLQSELVGLKARTQNAKQLLESIDWTTTGCLHGIDECYCAGCMVRFAEQWLSPALSSSESLSKEIMDGVRREVIQACIQALEKADDFMPVNPAHYLAAIKALETLSNTEEVSK